MLDLLYHFFNYITAGCYFLIFLLIFRGLVREKRLGHNLLGTATSGIFLTCGLGHFTHATTSHAWSGELWQSCIQVLVDGWTILPAITYLILRSKYGLIIRGPDMIEEYRSQLAQQTAELKALHEFEKLKDDFMAMAGHELRTPLTVIGGYAQILSMRLAGIGDKKVLTALNSINQQVERMTRMVTMLLDVGRIQSRKIQLTVERCNLNLLLSQLAENIQLTSPTHQLNLYLPAQPTWVLTDTEHLEQVIANLISNAVKYSPQAQQLEIKLDSHNGEALIAVTDYGSGISPEDLPHIFERFYRSAQVKNSTKEGLGLGLFISSELIRASGGRIEVVSRPDLGSTFTVHLPLAMALQPAAAEKLQLTG